LEVVASDPDAIGHLEGLTKTETALALNPHASGAIGFLGWLRAQYGEWERGLAILEKGKELNPHYPG
jgi:hypothetical protein